MVKKNASAKTLPLLYQSNLPGGDKPSHIPYSFTTFPSLSFKSERPCFIMRTMKEDVADSG